MLHRIGCLAAAPCPTSRRSAARKAFPSNQGGGWRTRKKPKPQRRWSKRRRPRANAPLAATHGERRGGTARGRPPRPEPPGAAQARSRRRGQAGPSPVQAGQPRAQRPAVPPLPSPQRPPPARSPHRQAELEVLLRQQQQVPLQRQARRRHLRPCAAGRA